VAEAKKTPRKKVHFRQAFLTGFVALFPIVLTLFVLKLCWNVIMTVSGPLGDLLNYAVTAATDFKGLPAWVGKVGALILALAAVYLIGLALASIVGRRIMGWLDAVIVRLPLVNYIYPHAKQLSQFIFGGGQVRFNRVVAVEYPRKGVYSMGFVTSDGIRSLSRRKGRRLIAVFVPTSPTPFTGWTVLVEEEEVLPLDMTVDEALRFTISCGVLVPGEMPREAGVIPGPILPPAAGRTAPRETA